MKKRLILAGLVLLLLVSIFTGCQNKQPEQNVIEPEVQSETELLLGFESYEEITEAGLRFSSLFGKTAVNKEKAYITEGEGSWMVMPQGNYGSSAWPYFRMRLDGTSVKNSSFMDYDKVMLDVYNTSDEEVNISWSFNVMDATGTYTETEANVYTLKPNAWTTCEYDFSADEYNSFFNLATVKLTTINILSKKESKDDAVKTLYFDNFRGHYDEEARILQSMSYDFREGITFENTTDRYLFVGSNATSQLMELSRSAYVEEGIKPLDKTMGEYALKANATGATWPAFTVNLGETYQKDMVLTFYIYVKADEAIAKEQTYFIESFYSEENKKPHEVLSSRTLKFNEWVEINVKLTEAVSSIWSYVNLDDMAGGNKLAGSTVSIYMDNFKMTEYQEDTSIAKDGTVTITNPYNTVSHDHMVEKAVKKGDMISFDIDFNTEEPLAVWVLGEEQWLQEWFAYGYEKWEGKQKITVKVPEDSDYFYIVYQYRGEGKDKTQNVCTISGIKVGQNKTVVKKDGTVVMYNESIGGKTLSYTFDKPAKAGEYITFTIDVNPAQHMAVWLLGDDMWEDEWYAYGYEEWTGKQTISVKAPEDTKNFTVQVEFRDNKKDFSKNKVTISNVKIGNNKVVKNKDGSVVLYNNYTGAKNLSYTFDKSAKKGQFIEFTVDVDPAQHMAVWLLGDDMWEDEWYAWGYEEWTGAQTIKVEVPSDTANFTIEVEFRDTTKDFSKNKVTISDVKVMDPPPGNKVTVAQDGTVTIKTLSGKNSVDYTFDKKVKKGQTIQFAVDVNPAQAMAVWLLGDDMWEDEWYAWGYEEWTGAQAIRVEVPSDTENFTVQVEFRDTTKDFTKNVVTISNVQVLDPPPANKVAIGEDGTVTIATLSGNKNAEYTFNKKAKKGDTISFEVDVSPAQAMAVWLLGDDMWEDEWYAYGYEGWTGKQTISVEVPSDTENFTVTVQFRDNTKDFTKNVITISNVRVEGEVMELSSKLSSGVLTVTGDGQANSSLIDGIDKSKVKEIRLEAGVTGIDAKTFDGFSKLEKVYYANTVTKVAENAFINCASGVLLRAVKGKEYTGGLVDPDIHPYYSFKCVTIGSSYGEDTNTYIYRLAKNYYASLPGRTEGDSDYDEIIVAELFTGGGTLEQRVTAIMGNPVATCHYERWDDEGVHVSPAADGALSAALMKKAMRDEYWDIVILMQSAEHSNRADTFVASTDGSGKADMDVVIDFIKSCNKNDAISKYYWLQTWSYNYKLNDSNFAAATGAEERQRLGIINSMQTVVQDRVDSGTLDGIIPVGAAIENLKATCINVSDTTYDFAAKPKDGKLYNNGKWSSLFAIQRDTAHASAGLGRFTLGLTAFSYLAGLEESEITGLAELCYPKTYAEYEVTEKLKGEQAQTGAYLEQEPVTDGHIAFSADAAIDAIISPYEVHGSTHMYEDGVCIVCKGEEPKPEAGVRITGFGENRLFQDWITPQRWYICLKFTETLRAGEAAQQLGDQYTAYINDVEHKVVLYKEQDGDIAVFIPATLVSGTPQEGTTIRIPAQVIETGYELASDFTMIYVNQGWRELKTLDEVALTSVQRTDVFITSESELEELYNRMGSAYQLKAADGTSGIYYGDNLAITSIEYSKWGGLYFSCDDIKGSKFDVGDVVSMKGIFTTTVNPDICYQLDTTYTCVAVGTTNPDNNLTQATWEIKTD